MKCYRCDRPISKDKGYYTTDNFEKTGVVYLCSRSCLIRHEELRLQIKQGRNYIAKRG